MDHSLADYITSKNVELTYKDMNHVNGYGMIRGFTTLRLRLPVLWTYAGSFVARPQCTSEIAALLRVLMISYNLETMKPRTDIQLDYTQDTFIAFGVLQIYYEQVSRSHPAHYRQVSRFHLAILERVARPKLRERHWLSK